jgi:hypothetical protein
MLTHYFSNAWRWASGLPEVELNQPVDFDPRAQWCPEFEDLMRARLLIGAYRYGPMKAPAKARYDRLTAIRKRLDAYACTGNAENLVDSANLLMLEFVEPDHPSFHFESSDDGEHVARL